MNLGAEPKKIAILGALVAAGGYFFYTNVIADSEQASSRPPGAAAAHNAAANGLLNSEPARGPVVRATTRSKASEEFRPSMKRKPDEAIDPMQIDPTLRLDLLAKVQAVEFAGPGRNPFQFGTPPPPPIPPDVKLRMEKIKEAMAKLPPAPTTAANPAVKPGPPPLHLSWKYYGYTSAHSSAQKKAFFLDGEDILTATEGEVLKKKYRVVRIGVNSVLLEDTDTKSQQTLPLQEEAA